ncbi:MAG: 1-acyl-sn-glycerol-3-phosphate acyltransferase [Oscillospiraceae bacterium]|jgi:1-acyl-sn-glycerol-3-phosphate acyltransferase|nr:1-acyl-sn-glycerol-3-phosphate acyltransferase [Oscillospiraceae bacterium]
MTRFYRIIYAIAAPIIHLLFPCRTVGLEDFPEEGALLCANHASGWDPILIALNLPKDARLTVMAKDQLFRIPLLGFFLKKLGIFPVKRGGNDLTAMKTAMKVLSGGNRLLVFPEGTRVEEQGEVEAKGGVTMMATRTGVPMVPVYCGGKHKFFRKTTIVFGKPYVPVIAGRRPTPDENRAIAQEILERIYALSEVDAWK